MKKYTLLLLLLPQLCFGQRFGAGLDAGMAHLVWGKMAAGNYSNLKSSVYLAPFVNIRIEKKLELELRYATSQVATKNAGNSINGRSGIIARMQHDVVLAVSRFLHQNRQGIFFGAEAGYAFYNNKEELGGPQKGSGICYGLHAGGRFAVMPNLFLQATLRLQQLEMTTTQDAVYNTTTTYSYYKTPVTIGFQYRFGKRSRYESVLGDPATN